MPLYSKPPQCTRGSTDLQKTEDNSQWNDDGEQNGHCVQNNDECRQQWTSNHKEVQ